MLKSEVIWKEHIDNEVRSYIERTYKEEVRNHNDRIIGNKNRNCKEENMDAEVRTMTIEDYDEIYKLWMKIKGFAIRSIDDSRIGVERFLKRNPDTSVVAVKDGKVVGAILCGHDGRRGCLYHVCVDPEYRKQGIGTAMVVFAMNALKKEKISKVSLIAFTQNDIGNAFWRKIGWTQRLDLNYYDFVLNTENIIAFNE